MPGIGSGRGRGDRQEVGNGGRSSTGGRARSNTGSANVGQHNRNRSTPSYEGSAAQGRDRARGRNGGGGSLLGNLLGELATPRNPARRPSYDDPGIFGTLAGIAGGPLIGGAVTLGAALSTAARDAGMERSCPMAGRGPAGWTGRSIWGRAAPAPADRCWTQEHPARRLCRIRQSRRGRAIRSTSAGAAGADARARCCPGIWAPAG
ncbi:MAG TPA: hypothetical protein VFO41_14660 [Alphaproteobacteria bacterium]|nr:hypothetical protein [Alphaproteobacteria bacterium]